MRLLETAKRAKAGSFEAFTTSTLSSSHMDHEAIREVGEAISAQADVPFLYRDFRGGWRQALDLCKELDLYRQTYCGCIFSEEERFQDTAAGSHSEF